MFLVEFYLVELSPRVTTDIWWYQFGPEESIGEGFKIVYFCVVVITKSKTFS